MAASSNTPTSDVDDRGTSVSDGRRVRIGNGVVIAAAVALSLAVQRPPAAASASIDGAEFSVERAMTHVRAIAAAPHPVGSPAHAAVREYLIATLRSVGLAPEVQTASVLGDRPSPSTAPVV